jgi:hypothetical protein
MYKKSVKCLLTGLCFLFSACAIITVNVYFPEKAVKEAYKSVDEMLLKGEEEKKPVEEQKPVETKPTSSLRNLLPGFSLVSEAYAADQMADNLAVELASMPEVNKAYEEMSRNLKKLNALFDSGVVGLTSQGLVTVRDKAKASPDIDTLIKTENNNRKTVVEGMAKAILKLDRKKESKGALAQIMGKAATTYAEIKRESAKPGWWTQLANGRWVQKQ